MTQLFTIACHLILALAHGRVGGYSRSRRTEGGDQDSYGCISSAGYEWCEKRGQCIKRWEFGLSLEEDFKKACSGLSLGPGPTLIPGVTVLDVFKTAIFALSTTLPAAVYEQSEALSCKCTGVFSARMLSCAMRPKELNCTYDNRKAACVQCPHGVEPKSPWACSPPTKNSVSGDSRSRRTEGGDEDSYGCIASTGYVWCEKRSQCIKRWEFGLSSEQDFKKACSGLPLGPGPALIPGVAVLDVFKTALFALSTFLDVSAVPNTVPLRFVRTSPLPQGTQTNFNATSLYANSSVSIHGWTTGGWDFCGIEDTGAGPYFVASGGFVECLSGCSGDEEKVTLRVRHDGSAREVVLRYNTRAG